MHELEGGLGAEHQAGLPWCCYDARREKVTIRLITTAEAQEAVLYHGDPYDYDRSSGAEKWRHEERPLVKQYSGAGKTVWRAEIDRPHWNRLMYGFGIRTAGASSYYGPQGFQPPDEGVISAYYNHFFYPYLHRVDAPGNPEWVKETVWYQIFPERFHNGDRSLSPPGTVDWETGEPAHRNFFGGDLRGIRQKLPYLKDLGVNGVYLTPLFQAPSNHKYDTEDYYSVDRCFGNLEDLKALVQEAHARGIRVMLDAVFNHAGKTHPFWQDVLRNQENSPYKDYFHIRGFPVKETYEDYRKKNFDSFAYSATMPKWNTENPRARKYLIDAALYWIKECDIDAWRLDVANEVSFDFWKDFTRQVHAAKKDFYVLGEVWYDAARWINPGCFDAVMNYPLGFAAAEFFLEKKASPRRFTENLFTALTRYSDLHNGLAFNLLDSHDTARALHRAGGDKLALRNAFTMLFLLPGTPCVYYGTEIGLSGGPDPQNRRPMIWDEARQDRELFGFFQKLLALRCAHIGLINNAAISYQDLGKAHCWTLSPLEPGHGSCLSILYSDEEPVTPETEWNLGRRIFGAAGSGAMLPPHTLGVYEKR